MRQLRRILRLHHEGNSTRDIVRVTGIARTTVQRALERSNAADLVWPLADDVSDEVLEERLYAGSRRIVMGSRLLGVYGQVQREGDVIHVIAKRLTDLSPMLSKLGERSAPFPGRLGRGDGAQNGGGPDPRTGKPSPPAPRDIYIPPLHLDEINVKARNFR